jgi:hypothetical protein
MTKKIYGRKQRIPYIAMWSSEHWHEIKDCPYTYGPAIFSSGALGEGTPVLGKMNEERQRRCMVMGLCQVCTCNLHLKTKYFVSDAVGSEVEGKGGQQILITEPPVCKQCFETAMQHCVGLRRQVESGRIQAGRVRKFDMCVQMLNASHPDFSHLINNDGKTSFAGYVRYMPRDWDLMTIERLKELAA